MGEYPFSLSEITDLVNIAKRAAIKAGSYLLEKRGQARIQAHKALRDDLLDVDLEEVGLSLSREGLEEPFGSHKTIKERNHEISAHFCGHQKRQHS